MRAFEHIHPTKSVARARVGLVTPLLLLLFGLPALPRPATAQAAKAPSAAELLEKGIYTEQTVGDLDAAIRIYERIAADEAANRPFVAQARYRLGLCHLKTGRTEAAREALEAVIRDFPEQEQLVLRAEERLASLRPSLAQQQAPWPDGEFLRYGMRLPTGKEIGNIYLTATATELDGVPVWQLELRRFVFGNSRGDGVSRVFVDRETHEPIRSSIRHGLLGTADATFGPEGVSIETEGKEVRIESPGQIFDNDQSMHLVRMLPLEVGYRNQMKFVPIWTGAQFDAEIEVMAEESCEVPAGTFACHAMALRMGPAEQTYWYGTGAERYPLRVRDQSTIIELAEIGQRDFTTPTPLESEAFGFATTLPPGWLSYEAGARPDKTAIRLLDPDAISLSSLEVDRCPKRGCPTLQQTAERELAGAERRFDGFDLREGSWNEFEIDGRAAISFVGDFPNDGEPWVQYRIYQFTGNVRLELIFRVPADRFDELRPDFDALIASFEAR